MNWIYPLFLSATVLMIIPILIHLFHFKRYRKMDFTMVKFLKSIHERNQNQNKLKHLLILCSRIFFILFLVLAFAKPVFEKLESFLSSGSIVLYLDNSFSLSNDVDNNAFQSSKDIASRIIKNNSERSFIIVDNTTKSIPLSAKTALERIQKIEQKTETKAIVSVASLLKNNAETVSKVYIISDFQKSLKLTELEKQDYSLDFIKVESNSENNISIDSVWLAAPFLDKQHPIEIVFKLSSNKKMEYLIKKVNLFINKENKGFSNVQFENSSSAIDTIKMSINEVGIQNAKLSISDEGYGYDNEIWFNLTIPDKVRVLAISETGEWRKGQVFFDQQENFDLIQMSTNNIDYGVFESMDLIVLNGLSEISTGMISEIQSFISSGHDLLIFPSDKIDLASYQNLQKAININGFYKLRNVNGKVGYLNRNAELSNGIFKRNSTLTGMSWPSFDYQLEVSKEYSKEVILKDENGLSCLERYSSGNSNIYQYNVGLDASDNSIEDNSLHVSLLYNIVAQSIHPNKLYYQINKDFYLPYSSEGLKQAKNLISEKGISRKVVPRKFKGRNVYFVSDIQNLEGIQKLENSQNSYAFNYSRKESFMDFYSNVEIKNIANKIGANFEVLSIDEVNEKDAEEGSMPLWKVCIIFVLVFLSLEMILIKFL